MRKPITPQQLKKLHTLLSNAGLMDMKQDFIAQYSNGRTESSRELFQDEAQQLISSLAKDDPCTKMKRKCIAICFEIGWFTDGNDTEWQINYAKLDLFLKKRGVVKKSFRALTCNEVRLVLGQLEGIEKHTRDTAERKKIADELTQILAESGIQPPKKSNRGTDNKMKVV